MKRLFILTGLLLLTGALFNRTIAQNRENQVREQSIKYQRLMAYIDAFYVDTVNLQKLTEDAIIKALSDLDPHSVYITKEEVDEMRKEFLSNVSHELKTPIALVQGYAEGLKECINDDPESREFYCDVIMDEAGKMNKLVKNLLTLNELEFGNEVVTMERFDLASMIHNMLRSMQVLFEQKDVKLVYDVQEPVYAWANEFKMEQVLNNYISNALNHVDGEKIIKITIQRQDGHVRAGVFNTGKPIPEEDVGRIWDKFYKVDKARTREYGGSGVGLSIVKAIMESMHQQYGVINYDNGVEFWFELDDKNEA